MLGDRGNTLGSLHRVMLFDALTREFTQAHPNAVVVSAGIGLCTRAQRLAGHVPAVVSRIGVDLPEVVALRKRLLPDEQVRVYAGSLTEPDGADDLLPPGRPALVLAEGVLMYLAPAGLVGFLSTVRSAFGPGTELAADCFHPKIARSDRHPIVRATGARFLSGARNGRGLAAPAPGWHLAAEYGVMERIGAAHRAAALAFRAAGLGGRPYAVARLRGVG